jgi:hypothetical protein
VVTVRTLYVMSVRRYDLVGSRLSGLGLNLLKLSIY